MNLWESRWQNKPLILVYSMVHAAKALIAISALGDMYTNWLLSVS
ncbi:hypothetical protein SPWS13_0617 [Shewanella putrefaciens]|nr:hypothetical protein SPWS13_0617 [Shewanella putrefaciens]